MLFSVVYWHLIGVGAGHHLFSATHSIEARGKLEQRGHQGQQEEGGRDQGRPSVRPVCLCCRSGGLFCHARQWTIGEGQRRQKAGRPKETLSQISLADQSQNAIWPVPLVDPPRKDGGKARGIHCSISKRRPRSSVGQLYCLPHSQRLGDWAKGRGASRPANARQGRQRGRWGDIIAVPRPSLATRDRAYGEGKHVHMMMS